MKVYELLQSLNPYRGTSPDKTSKSSLSPLGLHPRTTASPVPLCCFVLQGCFVIITPELSANCRFDVGRLVVHNYINSLVI